MNNLLSVLIILKLRLSCKKTAKMCPNCAMFASNELAARTLKRM